MSEPALFDVENIWKRVGLEKLRQQLRQVIVSSKKFEQSLRSLPACNECAKVVLLEHIQKTGRRLSGQVVSLTTLAETLKSTLKATEHVEKILIENAPPPCKCGSQKCSCHH